MEKTILLIVLFGCHFLADYTHLSNEWMLKAKKLGTPSLPILTHACMHGFLMLMAMWLLSIDANLSGTLVCFQVLTRFFIDMLKGRMNGWFPALQSPANKWHWIVFGLDQYLHAIVIILMVNYI